MEKFGTYDAVGWSSWKNKNLPAVLIAQSSRVTKGVASEPTSQSHASNKNNKEPFLCFGRYDLNV